MGTMIIYEKFKAPLIDFIEKAKEIPNLIGVILFGSAVTGDVSKKSDIDLLLITQSDHNPELGEESSKAHRITSEISKKYDLTHPFSLTFYNLSNEKDIDSDFLWEVCKGGIMLWGNPNFVLGKKIKEVLTPKFLCTYSLKELEDKDKRAVIRKLYESRSKLIGKEEKVSPGVLLIDAKKEPRLKEIFEECNVTNYRIKKIWTQ
jgi:predicted nucleotidyltransferase